MEIMMFLLGVVAANQQQLTPRRPFTINYQSLNNNHRNGPVWGSVMDVLKYNPSISQSYPLGAGYASPMEDYNQGLGLLQTVTIPNPLNPRNLLNSNDSTYHGFYWNPVKNNQPMLMSYQDLNLVYHELSRDSGIGFPRSLSSPYELNQQSSLPIRANEKKFFPKWTSMESTIQQAVTTIRINMVDPESESAVVPWWDIRADYTLLLGVIIELMEQVVIKGSQSYEEIFTGTVLPIHAKIRSSLTSNELARRLIEAGIDIDNASANLRSYINFMSNSEYCTSPLDCDSAIDIVLSTTPNQRLQTEKMLLLSAANLADIFLEYYAEEFETISTKSMTYIYISNLLRRGKINKLKPLVLAGAMLIRHVKELRSEEL